MASSESATLESTAMAPAITTIKSPATKDLPTRGKKLIRTRSRRNLPITSVTADKAKEKNGVSPQLSPKKDPTLSFAYIFPKAEPVEGENARFISQMSSSYPPPPPYTSRGESVLLKSNAVSSFPRESFYKSPPSPTVFVMETSSTGDDDLDEDRPLDMSKKCHDSHQQVRPSVITCASALYSSKCHHVDRASCLCSPNRTSPTRKLGSENDNSDDGVVEHRTGHRREISSGMCDPVIDEHFRRSLGKDYSEIFASTTSNSVSVTVDDHFAKALGDTWLRLQQPDNKDFSASKTATNLKHTPSLVTL